jgi:hypothetical protein
LDTLDEIDPALLRHCAIVRFRDIVEVTTPSFIGRLLTIALLQLVHRLRKDGHVGMDPLLILILD